MKKYLLGLFLVLGLVAALFGCKKTDAAGTGAQTTDLTRYMNWNIGADPKTLDPCLNGASDGGDVINQTFEGLVREKSGKLYPGIAREWSFSPDGLTLTFRLRESKWSDGTPLTATRPPLPSIPGFGNTPTSSAPLMPSMVAPWTPSVFAPLMT